MLEQNPSAEQSSSLLAALAEFESPEQARKVRSPFGSAMRLVVPFVCTILALLEVSPGSLRFVFPAAATVCGYLLYRKNEVYFLSFQVWIHMLTPLLRRFVDWKTSYQDESLVLLAPLLVTLIPLIDLRRRLLSVTPTIRYVALLALAGIAYGFGVGCLTHPEVSVVLAGLTWIAPIVLCIFAASIRAQDELARVLTRTILAGVLVMSVYGIYQYIIAPPWDTVWLRGITAGAAADAPSFGNPRPFGIRVWSTMNAPGPFSVFLSAFLIWLATRETLLSTLVALTGYAALLLTLVRSAWITTALGLLLLFLGCRPHLRIRRLLALLLIFAALGAGVGRISKTAEIQKRFETFSSLKSDASAGERKQMYRYMGGQIASMPSGVGLNTTYDVHGYPLDSSVIMLFYKLGWTGGCCYFAGVLLLIVEMGRRFRSSFSPKVAAAAIVFSGLTQALGGDVLYRQGGIALWLFVGVWACFDREPPSPDVRTVSPVSPAATRSRLSLSSVG